MSQQNTDARLSGRLLNKHSSISIAQIAIENEDKVKPARKIEKNVGLSGRFFRKMRPSPSEELFKMPGSRENINSQER